MCLHAVMEAITEGQTTDANIYGPQTTQGCWGSARGSYIHRWQPKYYAHTFAQLAAKEMKQAINTRSTTGRDLFPLSVGGIDAPENATTKLELLGTQSKERPLRRSARRKGAGTTPIQETQTPMPLCEIHNGIGPPPPDSLTGTRGMLRRHLAGNPLVRPPTEKSSNSPYGLACCKCATVAVPGMNCGAQPCLPQAP